MGLKGIRKAVGLLLVFSCLFSMSGCWDRTEIEEIAFALGVAVDFPKETKSKDIEEAPVKKVNPNIDAPDIAVSPGERGGHRLLGSRRISDHRRTSKFEGFEQRAKWDRCRQRLKAPPVGQCGSR